MSRLGYIVRRWGAWICAAALLVTCAVAPYAMRVQLETDISKFFADDDPVLKEFLFFSKNFGFTDVLVIAGYDLADDELKKFADLHTWLGRQGFFTRVMRPDLPGKDHTQVLLAFSKEPCTLLKHSSDMLKAVSAWLDEHDLDLKVAGAPAEVVQAQVAIHRDMTRTGLIAAAVIFVIMLLALGDLTAPVLGVMPLLMGICWLMALARGWFGDVNTLSACLPTSLLGIGIDYALHLHAGRNHVPEEDPQRAWAHVMRRVGPPLLVGALTTAGAFFTLAFARLRGLNQMGYLGGAGIIIIFVLSVACLPTLLDWGRRRQLRLPKLSMEWLVHLADWATHHRVAVITAFVLLTIPMGLMAASLEFETSPRAYEDASLPAMVTRTELADRLGMSFQPAVMATPGLKAEREVVDLVRPYVGRDKVFSRIDCLSERLDLPGVSPDMGLFRGRAADSKMLCMMLYPSGDVYDRNYLKRLNDTCERVRTAADGNVLAIAGGPIIAQKAIERTRSDMLRTGLLSSVTVLLILALLVRQVRVFLAAATPLAGGIVWMLGMVHLLGYRFNLANAVTMPLVLGLGIDYGVHIVYRLRRSNVHKVMSTAGRAILLSAVTTAAAFFSLCAARNNAIVAMGLAAGVGILSCLAWSVIFLPALLGQRAYRRSK